VTVAGYRRDLAWEALLRLGRATGRKDYRTFVLQAVERSGLTPDSSISYRAQPFGSVTFLLAEESGDRAWLDEFIKESTAYRREIPRTAEGAITHPRGKRRGGGDAVLIDALQEYASRMARAGQATGEEAYFAEAARQFRLHRAIVRDPASGLWSQGRGWLLEEPQRLSPGAWSRGHGWLIRGLVETLRHTPPESPEAATLRGYLKELADALLAVQQPSGMWHTLLHRPPEESSPEFSGTALISGYLGIALAEGFLEGEPYERAARRAYAALPRSVREDGVIESVSPGPGPLMEEEPYAGRTFPPGEEHGAFALFYAATGEARLDRRAADAAAGG
jgi:unsaturated rhamnogalacturonyl hydrolase